MIIMEPKALDRLKTLAEMRSLLLNEQRDAPPSLTFPEEMLGKSDSSHGHQAPRRRPRNHSFERAGLLLLLLLLFFFSSLIDFV